MHTIEEVRSLLGDTLNLGERAGSLHMDYPLLGSLPELDSMAVVYIISALEERFGMVIEDDEMNAGVFRTVGSLVAFVDQKLGR